MTLKPSIHFSKKFAPVPTLMLALGCVMMLMLMAGCMPAPSKVPPEPIAPQPGLVRLPLERYPEFNDHLNYDRLIDSIEMSLVYLRRLPPDRLLKFGSDRHSVAHLIESLEVFAVLANQNPDPERIKQAIAERFWVYQAMSNPNNQTVLFTGYYEPLLFGSLTPGPGYPVPLHSRPEDLLEIDLSLFDPELEGRRIIGRYTGQEVVPYLERGSIRKQDDFNSIAPPIAWVRDEIDLFNLQVQGSGKMVLEDGQLIQIQFDVSNGRPYRSIGRLLIDQGKISAEKMSMQAIRTYLQQHPQESAAIMNHNPRYIFFRQADHGPVGAAGVSLTPIRSLAVDRQIFPLGALAFILLPVPKVSPQGKIEQWVSYRGFALAQDTGSAIKGPNRADLFWGHGRQAEVAAGHLKHEGQLFFLVLKPDSTGT